VKLTPPVRVVFPPGSPAAVEPWRMFQCVNANLRVTAAGCGRMWISARDDRPAVWEGRSVCVGCPEGAKNAGCAVSTVAKSVGVLHRTCGRCLRPASRIINERFCISCYNRHAEALRGKNARGSRPRLSDQLHSIKIAVFNAEGARMISAHDVISAADAMIAFARKAELATAFGWGDCGPGVAA